MFLLSWGAERQPYFGRRAEAILKTQEQNTKKSTNGILCFGTKLRKRPPKF
jgi:hypothetical protein